ncbi:glycoside hydrolase family 3 protein [Sutcliffiella horikoshii]|uniref:glycoside hydrolase family 3 protein n=1 Tax=Sutcliffiella horikoshii TaxID=79883 RepID=UPI003CF41292
MKTIHEMTLREKVGQLFVAGFHGTAPSEEIVKLIKDYQISGVIYFARNVEDPKQVHALSKELQKAAKDAGAAPLFISIDQEGGMVARITDGVTLSPGNMALGAGRSEELVYELGEVVGKELRLLGINMNYAPCIDVNNNPLNPVIGVRSYGESEEFVAKMGVQAVKGLQDANVSAVVKHFPGHGDTSVDSHLDLPVVPHDIKRLKELELVPFYEAFKHGVDAVMVAHVAFPSIDPEKVPSTLSRKVVTELLRGEMGYEGVVVTDCMEMNAIIDYFGIEEAAILAIEAGIDQVLISHTFERQTRAIEAVIKAVELGRISLEHIDAAVERVLTLKEARNLQEGLLDWDDCESEIGTASNVELAQKASEASITLVRESVGLLPLASKDKILLISVDPYVTSGADDTLYPEVTIGSFLEGKLPKLTEVISSVTPEEEDIEKLLLLASVVDKIMVATYQAVQHDSQADLVRRLVKKYGDKVGVIALRSPYDVDKFPEVSTYILTYESRKLALKSVSKFLLGEIEAKGKLPITLGTAQVN